MFESGLIRFVEFSGASVGPRDRSPSAVFGAARCASRPAVVSVAFHPATVSRAMRTRRARCPIGLPALAHPPRRVLARRTAPRWSVVSVVFRPACAYAFRSSARDRLPSSDTFGAERHASRNRCTLMDARPRRSARTGGVTRDDRGASRG